MSNNQGCHRTHRWLKEDQRDEVRRLLKTGVRPEELAVKFDVHFNTIRNIGREGTLPRPEQTTLFAGAENPSFLRRKRAATISEAVESPDRPLTHEALAESPSEASTLAGFAEAVLEEGN